MGDVVSSHLDEAKREMISARTGEVTGEFGRLYEQQYTVALFNKVRFDIEGGGGPQPQLLHRKIPLENKSIFSGSLFQYLEDNRKWRNRFLFIPDSYNINYYDNKAAHDKHLHPKGTINCAGYKVLTSLDLYLELISNSLPGVKAKVGSSPFLKCATPFILILWHPYARHFYFCVGTEKEQQKWAAVLQDCVRHANDGLSEENRVQTPAFTDAVRLYRQAQGHYGTWEMMCGTPTQILSNLVMEGLHPELRDLISPRLKGKLHDRQRNWMLISDAVYDLVQAQCQAQYQALLQRREAARSSLEASIRTDMDQIITSKEHVTNKIRAVVLPKAEKLLKVSIQPYIASILDALMEPTSRGFFEVRDVFFRELVDMSKNTLNQGTKEAVAQHMDKISMLAFHPVKMQSCYEKVETLSLEGLQQRFDVSSPSVFVQRAQILMREQMDDAVYTFEQILHQSLESQGSKDLCKTIQRCQDRVIKKFDYDSSTVRKRFFREALLQIFIPYMLKQLGPSCASELPRFQELIFEDFSRFILVENIFEEVVLHSVMKDITMAVKEAAVQRRHNLYRDSIVLSSSDPSLHLLGENPSIDWAGEYGGGPEEEEEQEVTDGPGEAEEGASQKRRRMKQVVSMIQVDGSAVLPGESCLEVPGVDDIPEEEEEEEEEEDDDDDSEVSSPKAQETLPEMSNGSVVKVEEGKEEDLPTDGNSVSVEKNKDVAALESSQGMMNGSLVKGEVKSVEEVQEEAQKKAEGDSPSVEKKAPSPEPSEASLEVSNSSMVKVEEVKPVEDDKEAAPLKAEEGSPTVDEKEEKDLVPESSEVPSEISKDSVEEGHKEVSPKAEAAEEKDDKGEDTKLEVEDQPLSNQEESEEALPPPPPEDSIPSEPSPESPPEASLELRPPPHHDGDLQSTTSKEEAKPEEEVLSKPSSEEKKANVATEPTTSDSESKDQ